MRRINVPGSAVNITAGAFFHKARGDVQLVPTFWLSTMLCCSLTWPCDSRPTTIRQLQSSRRFERAILDEAHHLEDVATNYFSSQLTRFTFSRILNRLRHPRKLNQGLLPRFLDQLSQELPDSLDQLYRGLHGEIESLLNKRQQLLDLALDEISEYC